MIKSGGMHDQKFRQLGLAVFIVGVTFASSTLWAQPDSSGLEHSFRQAIAEGQISWAALLALLAGFLTALSPCVYPLIPITLSIMGARRYESHLQGFTVSLAYVFGMVILYSGLGILFASLGWLAGSSLQSVWVTVFVATLFIVMAMSMFGAFDVVLPQSFTNRVAKIGGAGHKGAFLMGLVAGVIAAPCTGPVLTFILTLIAGDGNWVAGAVLMTLYGLGIGLPFLVLGTFSSSLAHLPKSGPWMDVVKNIFGVAMTSVGIYYLQFALVDLHRWFDTWVARATLVWSLMIVTGLVLGALFFSFKKDVLAARIRRGTGVILLALGLNGFINWLQLPPVGGEEIGVSELSWQIVDHQAGTIERFQKMLADARLSQKPVIIDFYADWCVACKELDRYTYADSEVRKELERFVLIKVDATQDTDALSELQDRFHVVGLPTILFMDSKGQVLVSPSFFGFVKAEVLLKAIKEVR